MERSIITPAPVVPGEVPASRPSRGGPAHWLLGLALVLGGLTLASGCGDGGSGGSGQMIEVDQEKIKQQQDSMREAMEKAHQRPTGKGGR